MHECVLLLLPHSLETSGRLISVLFAVFCVAQNERLSDGKRFLTVPPQRAYSSDIGPEWELDPAEIDWRKSVLIGKVRHLSLPWALSALVAIGSISGAV
jgi:hypothetical protein